MSYYTIKEQQEIQERWVARLEHWQKSGLNGAAWCRQEGAVYHQFIYWKSRIIGADQKFDPRSFIELDDHPESSGVEIVLAGASIHLSKDFDSSTLVRCVKALQEVKC